VQAATRRDLQEGGSQWREREQHGGATTGLVGRLVGWSVGDCRSRGRCRRRLTDASAQGTSRTPAHTHVASDGRPLRGHPRQVTAGVPVAQRRQRSEIHPFVTNHRSTSCNVSLCGQCFCTRSGFASGRPPRGTARQAGRQAPPTNEQHARTRESSCEGSPAPAAWTRTPASGPRSSNRGSSSSPRPTTRRTARRKTPELPPAWPRVRNQTQRAQSDRTRERRRRPRANRLRCVVEARITHARTAAVDQRSGGVLSRKQSTECIKGHCYPARNCMDVINEKS
jgi:hypothetical protein